MKVNNYLNKSECHGFGTKSTKIEIYLIELKFNSRLCTYRKQNVAAEKGT